MSSFKDIVEFIKQVLTDQVTQHNDIRSCAHEEGFNQPLKIFQQGYGSRNVVITHGTEQLTSYPKGNEAKINLFSSGSSNIGAIAFLGLKDSNDPNNYITRALIDVDSSSTSTGGKRTQMEFHFYDANGNTIFQKGMFLIRADVPASGDATAENTTLTMWKYDVSSGQYVELATKADVPKYSYPVVDYSNVETWFGNPGQTTATKNGIVRCWQARYNGYLKVNGVHCGSVSDAAQHNGYAIVAPGDVVSWKAHGNGQTWFYPFK